MTALAPPPLTQGLDVTPTAARPVRLGVLRAEWLKMLSLRSTWWALGATTALVTLAAFAVGMSLDGLAADPGTAPMLTEMDGATVIAGGYQIGMITIAVLGALAITGEYSTGLVRSTFTAVPTRLPALVAKGLVLTALTLVAAVLGFGLSWGVTRPLVEEHGLVTDLADPGAWRQVGGAALFMVVAGLFSLGLGTILRSTAGTVAAALTVLLVLPGVLGFVRLDWVETLVSYLPAPAASAYINGGSTSLGESLTPGVGLAVVIAYAVVPMVIGAVLLRRRDA